MTQHLSGKQPDPKKLNLYPDIATGLGRLHLLLAKIPQNFYVADSNLLSDIHCHLAALSKTEFGKASEKDKDISDLLRFAFGRLNRGFPDLEKLNVQLIHGDFSHPNIRITTTGPSRIVSLLDFEFCSVDPPIMDLATLALTILLRSGASDPQQIIRQAISCYEESVQQIVSYRLVKLAMLARKVDSYYYHRTRWERGNAPRELVQRQISQMEKAKFSKDQSLDQYLSEESWKKLVGALGSIFTEDYLKSLKPWYANLLILQVALQSLNFKGLLDLELVGYAKSKGLNIVYLEDVYSTFAVMEGISPAYILDADIKESDDLIADTKKELLAMYDCYKISDVSCLARMLVGTKGDGGSMRDWQIELISKQRNRIWVPIIEKSLESGQSFIAVGAGHLVGEDSVLSLLKENGFSIERVHFESDKAH